MDQSAIHRSRLFTFAALVLIAAFSDAILLRPQPARKPPRTPPPPAPLWQRRSAAKTRELTFNAQRIASKSFLPLSLVIQKVVTPDTNADWEADVTADSIAGTLIDSSGARAIHGLRSDSTSWNTAVLVLTGPLPASTFALVDNSSATLRAGAENLNGEDTIKYAIDTSQDTLADASLIKSMLGENGFVKGSAWVTHAGCPVKFVLDVQQFLHDGSVQKEHYEENVTKP